MPRRSRGYRGSRPPSSAPGTALAIGAHRPIGTFPGSSSRPRQASYARGGGPDSETLWEEVTCTWSSLTTGRRSAGCPALVLEGLRADPALVLGVATGSSPATTYRALCPRDGATSQRVRCVALDEYVGLPGRSPVLPRVRRREIAEPLGIRPDNVLVPDGNAPDPSGGAALRGAIRELGGVGIQLLGIGRNGHVGFNEPGSPLVPARRRAPQRDHPAGQRPFFARPDDVPTCCITQGVATIVAARKIVLVASGAHKADAVAAAVAGPVTEDCPASILQRHPDVSVVVDREAAALLALPGQGADRQGRSRGRSWSPWRRSRAGTACPRARSG